MSYIVRDLGGAGGASVMGKVGHGLGLPLPPIVTKNHHC